MPEAAAAPAPAAPAPAPVAAPPTPAPAPEAAAPTSAPTVLGAEPEKKESAAPAPPAPAPADGEELELKLPEGTEINEEVMTSFKALAKESGLKSEGAQKMIDLYASAQSGLATKAEEAHTKQVAEWASSVKADKELGGSNHFVSVATAQAAVRRFGSPALVGLLNQTGLGNHPELVRAFYRAGKAISEDTIAGSSAAAPQAEPASLADLLYPKKD